MPHPPSLIFRTGNPTTSRAEIQHNESVGAGVHDRRLTGGVRAEHSAYLTAQSPEIFFSACILVAMSRSWSAIRSTLPHFRTCSGRSSYSRSGGICRGTRFVQGSLTNVADNLRLLPIRIVEPDHVPADRFLAGVVDLLEPDGPEHLRGIEVPVIGRLDFPGIVGPDNDRITLAAVLSRAAAEMRPAPRDDSACRPHSYSTAPRLRSCPA